MVWLGRLWACWSVLPSSVMIGRLLHLPAELSCMQTMSDEPAVSSTPRQGAGIGMGGWGLAEADSLSWDWGRLEALKTVLGTPTN